MKYIECPDEFNGDEKSVFLAGGITGCLNWQNEMVNLLKDENITLINPRRKEYPKNDPDIEKKQITWEYEHLKKTEAILFWFPNETNCPITLYELGTLSMTDKPVFVGLDPDYSRKIDVEIQTKLRRPEIKIVYSLKELSNQIKKWVASTK